MCFYCLSLSLLCSFTFLLWLLRASNHLSTLLLSVLKDFASRERAWSQLSFFSLLTCDDHSLYPCHENTGSGHPFSGSLGCHRLLLTLCLHVCLLGSALYFLYRLHIRLCFGAPDHHSWPFCVPWKGPTYEMHLDFLIFNFNTTEPTPSSSLEPHFDLCLGYRNLFVLPSYTMAEGK